MILALILFAVTYVLMLRLQQYRPWVALCSAVLFIVLGEAGVYGFSLRAALQAVDYNVLLMMAGTMGTVSLFIESRMPARLAELLIVLMMAFNLWMSEERPNVLDLLESGLVDYIISTSPHGRDPHRDSVKFRRKATELSIPTITAMDTARVLVDALRGDHDISQMELVDIANLHREAAKGE